MFDVKMRYDVPMQEVSIRVIEEYSGRSFISTISKSAFMSRDDNEFLFILKGIINQAYLMGTKVDINPSEIANELRIAELEEEVRLWKDKANDSIESANKVYRGALSLNNPLKEQIATLQAQLEEANNKLDKYKLSEDTLKHLFDSGRDFSLQGNTSEHEMLKRAFSALEEAKSSQVAKSHWDKF